MGGKIGEEGAYSVQKGEGVLKVDWTEMNPEETRQRAVELIRIDIWLMMCWQNWRPRKYVTLVILCPILTSKQPCTWTKTRSRSKKKGPPTRSRMISSVQMEFTSPSFRDALTYLKRTPNTKSRQPLQILTIFSHFRTPCQVYTSHKHQFN